MDCISESLHILQGEFVLRTSAGDFHMHQGDTTTFPGSEPHSWYNPGDQTAKVLWILTGSAQTATSTIQKRTSIMLETPRVVDNGNIGPVNSALVPRYSGVNLC